ncbi:GL17269 [Drosophila persimilis]|uniref:GL17269 n=1 Tax=Drosophila persimilis TaxID=7234 RepID=B4GIU5_DROPE|nr:GL17269 [Drosophila persimilis]
MKLKSQFPIGTPQPSRTEAQSQSFRSGVRQRENRRGVYDWLKVRVRNKTFNERPIFMPLRKELYTFGLSEMCHTNDTREWSDYINCAIMRNMRMEYMIPKYPLHQISYFYRDYHGATMFQQGHFSTHAPGFGGK